MERFGIKPDILVIGKGLGGASMPLAALIARADFDVGQHVSLGHYTHEKNPMACAAGLAVLDVIEEEQLLARSPRLGLVVVARLSQMTATLPAVAEVRVAGLLVGVDLCSKGTRNAADLAEPCCTVV